MGHDHDLWLEGLGVDVQACREAGEGKDVPRQAGRQQKKAKHHKGHHQQSKTTVRVGQASGSVEVGYHEDPRSGATMGGVKMQGRAVGVQIDKKTKGGGRVSESFLEAEGSAQAGYQYDPRTGQEFAGIKASGKAAVAEVNADTPIGNVSGSFLKADGSFVAGYDYDPESKVTFAGVKANGSASVFDGKVQGKYGNVSGQLLSVSASSKTGVEVDEKTGKVFIGTSNSAEAKVAEVSGTLQTPDGSAQVTGDVQVLKASASADANIVADKYGFDVNAKAGAEANLVKGEVGAEYRLTPKALFDNTIGWMTNTTAPDVLDIGPVIGAKVSAGEGVGGTVEAGGRLGVDEVNVRGGGFLELAEGVGLDFKAGMRLGPLKVAYDNKDEIEKAVTDFGNEASKEATAVATGVSDFATNTAAQAVDVVQDVGTAASQGISDAGTAVSDFASNTATQAAAAVSSVQATVNQDIDATVSAVGNFASNAASTAGGAAQDLADAASNTWNNLWN